MDFSLGINDLGGDGVIFLENGRLVLENAGSAQNLSLILAAQRTKRIDPTDHFKHYTGGWNISNKHYFAVSFLSIRDAFILSKVNLFQTSDLFRFKIQTIILKILSLNKLTPKTVEIQKSHPSINRV